MLDLTFPVMAVWANAMVFALAGLVNLAGVGTVRQIYSRWDVPAATYRTIGLIEILAAAFLAQPDMRIWGIALAVPIAFGAVIILLEHRNYAYAMAVTLILASFIPAMLAVPPARTIIQYAT